jgi:hypothetical protein
MGQDYRLIVVLVNNLFLSLFSDKPKQYYNKLLYKGYKA